MFDVVTFGSAVVDFFVDTDVAEKKGFMYYPVGSKILIKSLKFDIGGGGSNTAVAFSRLGLKTGYIGKIGDDNEGKGILEMLKRERVKFLGRVEKNSVSGHSIILDSKGGDRTILTYKGINDHLALGEIKLRKIKTKWLYLSSLLGESFKTQVKLSQILYKRGAKIAFNPSEYLIKNLNLAPILKICEVLVLNKEEAFLMARKYCSGEKDVLIALNSLGPNIVVVTDKDKVVYAYNGKRKYNLRPHNVKVVERTGAGDAFASGFVAGRIVGKNIEESLKLGLEEGESVLRYFGAKNNLLRRKLK